MIPNRILFRIAFPTVPEPVGDVWRTLVSCLEREKCLPKQFRVSQIAGHRLDMRSERRLKLTSDEIVDFIVERKLDSFFVDTGHSTRSVCYSLLHMKDQGRQSQLACRIEDKTKVPNDWTPLIERVMLQWPNIGGWQWNHRYLCWQGYSLVEGYERLNGPMPRGVRRYIEKSVCTLSADREMIDVSLNPGRSKELIPGIRFVPTAEMWLGSHFWQYATCTKADVLAADFFQEIRDTPHFLYLRSWPQAFTRPDGEQGRIQQKLWRLFFNEDCEWPPGSGGISNEAVYGPPE
jgi:hypothetical protein